MENEELVIRINAGIDIAENMLQLYQQTKGLIYSIAKNYSGLAELDDLEQEGYIGLCNATRHYDPGKGAFSTYAVFWIKQAMQQYITNCVCIVRLPAYARNEVQKYKKVLSEYRKCYGKDPTDWEMKDFLGVNMKKLESIKNNVYMTKTRSLSESIGGEEEDITLEDSIPDVQNIEDEVMQELDTSTMKAELWTAVDKLQDQCPVILRQKYQNNKSTKEISEKLGINEAKVRRLENKAYLTLYRSRELKGFYNQYITHHVGVREFNRTWMSEVELAVIER